MPYRIEMSVSHIQGVTDHLIRGGIVGLDSFEHPAAEPNQRDLGPGIEGRRLGTHVAIAVEVSESVYVVDIRCISDPFVHDASTFAPHSTLDATYIHFAHGEPRRRSTCRPIPPARVSHT